MGMTGMPTIVNERPNDTEPVMEVENLACVFKGSDGDVFALNGVSLRIMPGEIVALVGESGCGKSVTAMAAMGLVPGDALREMTGSIRFDGRDVIGLEDEQWRQLRGREIGMIFQDPMTALNPMMTIGDQIGEILVWHEKLGRGAVRARVLDLLEATRIPDPDRRIDEYPHQLSGGMRQRVVIAMAIACRPRLLIADEPTTALDVTIQAQILRLLEDLREETGSAIMLITHDLGVVAEVADRTAVIYAGRVVESAETGQLLNAPLHPYTANLMRAAPDIEAILNAPEGELPHIPEIPGIVPRLTERPRGCPFARRCDRAEQRCDTTVPPETDWGDGHMVACWNPVPFEKGAK